MESHDGKQKPATSHVDYMAAFTPQHALQNRADAVEHAHAIDADFLRPFVLVQLRHPRVVHDTGAVHKNAYRQP